MKRSPSEVAHSTPYPFTTAKQSAGYNSKKQMLHACVSQGNTAGSEKNATKDASTQRLSCVRAFESLSGGDRKAM